MEWHNTTLLYYFMDFCTFIISPKSFNCEDLKTGAVYCGFYEQYERFEQVLCVAAIALLWAVKSMDC